MRTKKMQEGGMPAMNKMAQRKAMTQKAAANRSGTFRDPEHGGPSMPLASDVKRDFTGTTSMGDPFTAQQDVIGDITTVTPGQLEGYNVVEDEDGNIFQEAVYGDDVTTTVQGVIGQEDAEGAEVSGSGVGGFQSGEKGMMVQKKDMKAEHGAMMKKFKEGGMSVMDPVDFVAMLRDNRKK